MPNISFNNYEFEEQLLIYKVKFIFKFHHIFSLFHSEYKTKFLSDL